MQDAGGPVDEGRGIAPGEEVDVADEVGVKKSGGATGRGKVGEVVDVGDLDVIHYEEIFEGAASADD